MEIISSVITTADTELLKKVILAEIETEDRPLEEVFNEDTGWVLRDPSS